MWLSVGKVTKRLPHAVWVWDVLQGVQSVLATLARGQCASSVCSFPGRQKLHQY